MTARAEKAAAAARGFVDRQLGRPAPAEPYKCTDYGNAERLVARHGGDLRFVPEWNRWLVWDARRWKSDYNGEIERFAKATVRSILKEAEGVTHNQALRASLFKHALASEAHRRIGAMISLAKSEPGIAVRHADLDAEPWLLSVENGTLDLRTGKLTGPRREALLTKLSAVSYEPGASCPTWLSFLDRVMSGNAELVGFLQRAIGYSLTGSTREQCLFFLHGTGANGKTTFLETLRALLGEHAIQADFSTFLEKRSEGPRNDVARLAGARVVTSSEVGEGKRLDEGLVKSLTGSEAISARFLYAEAFEFAPQFKLWLAANHKPVIRGTDDAIWRRVRMIPFTVQIPEKERDQQLLVKLRGELPGILAWAVEGCLAWQRDGLGAPREVLAATDAYRAESDTLGGFLGECCVLDTQAATPMTELHKAYVQWAKDNGERELSKIQLGMKLTERGFATKNAGPKHTAHRIGLRLLSTSDTSLFPDAQERPERPRETNTGNTLKSENGGGLPKEPLQASLGLRVSPAGEGGCQDKAYGTTSGVLHSVPESEQDPELTAERAAILEFEAGLEREEAERRARGEPDEC